VGLSRNAPTKGINVLVVLNAFAVMGWIVELTLTKTDETACTAKANKG